MNKGISEQDLTEHEIIIAFKRMQSYVVPAGMKHQIVHNSQREDVGIAISTNGSKGFRRKRAEVVYWFTGPYAYVASVPMMSQGITINLDSLV